MRARLWGGGGPGVGVGKPAHAGTEGGFARVPERWLEANVAGGEWRDRAGAYAIQSKASAFVEEIRGDYTNVVGLPVPLLAAMLREQGQWPFCPPF